MKNLINMSIIFVTLSVLFGNINTVHALPNHDIATTIDQLIEEKLSEKRIPNAVVSVVHNGKVIFEKGYGYANIDAQTPIDPETSLFRIGSISKLITWTAVMQLVEQGKLDLDIDVNEYMDVHIPDFEGSEPITLRHLLTHTPGFEDYTNKIFTLEETNILPLEEYVHEFLPERIFPSGEILAYSNYGTALAGYIIEKVSGVPYETYVEENIFHKLDMRQSTLKQPIPEPLSSFSVTPYRYINGEFKEAKFEYMPTPAGGMSSSASDMAKFMIALLNHGQYEDESILKEETVKQMFTQQFTHHPTLNGMTLGFIETDMNGQRVLMHGGSTMLFNSMFYILPDEKFGIFMSYSGGNHLLHNEVLHELMNAFYPQEEVFIPSNKVSVERHKKYAGEYHQNRKSETTEEKFTSLHIGVIQVEVAHDGYLEVTHNGETHPFYEDEMGIFKSTRTERSPDAYGDFRTIVFKEDGEGNLLLIPDGPMTYTKASWYETSSFTFMSLGVIIIFIIGTLIVWFILGVVRILRRKQSSVTNKERFVKWIGIVYGFMIVILLGSLIMNGEIDPLYQLPKEAYEATSGNIFMDVFSYLFILVTIGLIISFVFLWKSSQRIFNKVHYTIYAGTAFFFIWLFYNYNLF